MENLIKLRLTNQKKLASCPELGSAQPQLVIEYFGKLLCIATIAIVVLAYALGIPNIQKKWEIYRQFPRINL